MKSAITFALAMLMTVSAGAQEKNRIDKKWIFSMVAVVGANVLDAHSSLGRYEGNPLLRNQAGRFDAGRSATIKIGASGSFLAAQLLLHRHYNSASLDRAFTITNSAIAGVVTRTALANYHTAPTPSLPAAALSAAAAPAR